MNLDFDDSASENAQNLLQIIPKDLGQDNLDLQDDQEEDVKVNDFEVPQYSELIAQNMVEKIIVLTFVRSEEIKRDAKIKSHCSIYADKLLDFFMQESVIKHESDDVNAKDQLYQGKIFYNDDEELTTKNSWIHFQCPVGFIH